MIPVSVNRQVRAAERALTNTTMKGAVISLPFPLVNTWRGHSGYRSLKIDSAWFSQIPKMATKTRPTVSGITTRLSDAGVVVVRRHPVRVLLTRQHWKTRLVQTEGKDKGSRFRKQLIGTTHKVPPMMKRTMPTQSKLRSASFHGTPLGCFGG